MDELDKDSSGGHPNDQRKSKINNYINRYVIPLPSCGRYGLALVFGRV